MNLQTKAHEWFRIPYVLSIRYKQMRRPLRTTYILIHGIASTGEMWQPLIKKLPKDSNYIAVDLLGHGLSPYPVGDAVYSASEQARNVMVTCLKAGLSGPVVLVGHSFGSLVAVEFAHHYKGIVRQMILVAPPIYRDETKEGGARIKQETVIRSIYSQVLKQPNMIIKSYALAQKLAAAGFPETPFDENSFIGFAGTLRSGIISQRASQYLLKTKVPTFIVYGIFDPVLVPRNFAALAAANHWITAKAVVSGHILRSAMIKEILRVINLAEKKST